MLACGPSCNCSGRCRQPGLAGFFSTLLNVAGTLVGDPALGNQVAAQASPGYAPVTQSADQVATTVSPAVLDALHQPSGKPLQANAVTQQVAAYALQPIAQQLASQGYQFPPGTVGAELVKPSLLDAFGAQNRQLVMVGGLALGGLFLLKWIRR